LDAPKRTPSNALFVASLGACLLHGLLLGAAAYASTHRVQQDISPIRDVPKLEVELVQLPPSEPEPEPEPEQTPPTPPPTAAKPTKPPPTPKAPPPAAAESAKVATAEPDIVEFGDTFVTGNAASYAGGVSANEGTAKHAVHDKNAQAAGVVGGIGKDLNADASRPPALASGLQWDCPFPVEADDAGIDSAVVSLRVEVSLDGKVREARATTDPGHGFAREARRCALSKRWAPGLDRAGRPTTAVALVNVRFER
jgi:outer membrane biosynthesis protein TonB